MLEFKSVAAGYHKHAVIEDMNLTFLPGEITAVIGPNGSGKSTMLKAAVDLCEVLEGEILLNGVKRKEIGSKAFAREVSYLPQIHAGGAIRVSKMVLHGRFPYLTDYPRRYGEKDQECCRQAMERIGILDLKDRNVGELSGGQRQKVYLAMALAGETKVFLFDEPTTYLDIRHQLEVLEVMRQLKDQGSTVVTVLHDLNYAMQTADRVLVVDQGRQVFLGTPLQVYESGVIPQVFGVRAKALTDEDGNRHFYYQMERK